MEYSKIGDICLKVCSGGTPTSSNPNYYNGGIPWLNTNEVNFCNIYSTNKTISQEGLEHSAAKYIPANTVIVAMYGVTAGKSAIVKIPLTTNQACCNLVIDAAKADYRYVYYFLKQQSDNLNKLANGGAQQNLNSLIIKKYKIALPDLEVQRRIASILSTYDTLIENNTKRIRLLEKMAENLYKEWFVRFRFPGHENVEMEKGLPKGWKYCRLSKVSEYSNSKIPSEQVTFYVSTENMMKDFGGIDQNVLSRPSEGSATKVETGNILISNIRPYFKKIWFADKEAACSNDVLNIKAKDGIPPMFLYHSLKQDSFFRYMTIGSNGTKMPRGNKNFTMKYPIIIPTGNIMVVFSDIAIKLNKWGSILRQQNSLLARQRDLLLPRLMSGKLEVKM